MFLLAAMLTAAAAPTITPYAPAMLPPGLTAEQGVAWDDDNGRNVLTWVGSDVVTLTHHVIDDGQLYYYRQHTVAAPECEDDLTFAMDELVSVTDADQDGIGEVTFGFEIGCMTDVSARSIQLHLWEDGAAHQLWGETVWWNLDNTGTVTVPQLSGSLADSPALSTHLMDRFDDTVRSERAVYGDEPVVLNFLKVPAQH